jgi:L-threonylcarbamoyladenylate synthase
VTVVPFRTESDVAAATPIVAEHLRGGGLLAYPTETVYGLGSRASPRDLADLAALKERDPARPFLLLVCDMAMIHAHGLVLTSAARALADRFWPGPLTLVLRGGEGQLPDALRGSEGGIAVRWTSHRHTADLIAGLGEPITSTSANPRGGDTAPGVGAIRRSFAAAVESGRLLILDGGVLGNVPPSSVVDCTNPVPRLIREGAILRAELRARAGRFAP